GYAIDGAGTLYQTTTGGSQWGTLTTLGDDARALAAPDTSTLLVAGDSGILRSTDAGASVDHVAGLTDGVAFAALDVVASGVVVLHTHDGGASWAPEPVAPGRVSALAAAAAPGGTVYAVAGVDGLLTTDRALRSGDRQRTALGLRSAGHRLPRAGAVTVSGQL